MARDFEFLLKAADEDAADDFGGLGIPYDQWREALSPTTVETEQVDGWGNLVLRIEGCTVSFSDEPVGIQIFFGDTDLPEDRIEAIAEEIRQQAESFAGRRAVLVRIG